MTFSRKTLWAMSTLCLLAALIAVVGADALGGATLSPENPATLVAVAGAATSLLLLLLVRGGNRCPRCHAHMQYVVAEGPSVGIRVPVVDLVMRDCSCCGFVRD